MKRFFYPAILDTEPQISQVTPIKELYCKFQGFFQNLIRVITSNLSKPRSGCKSESKLKIAVFCSFFLIAAAYSAHAYRILYAEQFYKLYHLHFSQSPEDTLENIFYLEQALRSDFANPLYALAKINNPEEWERYRNLFRMHVNLRLVQLHLTLASGWDKRVAYFFNAPWRKQNLESLGKAEAIYKAARGYWLEAKKWSSEAGKRRIQLPEIQNWADESFRIENGELDYDRIIDKQLTRLARVRKQFENMDENTY